MPLRLVREARAGLVGAGQHRENHHRFSNLLGEDAPTEGQLLNDRRQISVAEICGNTRLATPLHLVHRLVRRTQ